MRKSMNKITVPSPQHLKITRAPKAEIDDAALDVSGAFRSVTNSKMHFFSKMHGFDLFSQMVK